MDKVKVGVVGVGYLGKIHAQKYAGIPEAELVGVVDIDKACCHDVAAQTNCRSFYDYRDLMGQVEAVSIAVPTIAHYEVAKDFFLAGVDVLLEKPIAATVREAQELNALARERGTIFQIGHLERFNGAIASMNGVVKGPLLIDASRLSPFSGRGTDVDVILDLMIHDIDIILNIVGSEVERIEAHGAPFLSPRIDVAYARITFKNGCVANISASRIAEEKVRKMVILQNDSCLSVDYIKQSLTITRTGETEKEGVQVDHLVRQTDSLETQLKAFLRSVRERTNPIVPGEDGQRALEVALQIAAVINKAMKGKG